MNDPQTMQMQREAEQRVQRMAERSRRLVREQPMHVYRPVPTPPCEPHKQEMPPKEAACVVREETPCVCEPHTEAGDSESWLLLLLILVLWRNHAPLELILALLYIAL
jgi:hypothetical protein